MNNPLSLPCGAMKGMSRPLVTEEPVEFENELVEVKDFRIPIDHSRGTQKNMPPSSKGTQKIITCS